MSFRYPRPAAPSLSRSSSLRGLELGGSSSQPRTKAPISPPETERSAPAHATLDRNAVDHHVPPMVDAAEGNSPEDNTPYMRHTRRAPSIHYNQPHSVTGRSYAQRGPRWLVVVMPPSSLNVEPALGHTLAMGPPGRFQSGILMPLFPTMYAQLAAIAKEFNLPSTSGVCIYLHVSKADMNISPRISDDTWQLLWGPHFNAEETMAPSPSGLPICGKIEFDVDIRKARWYESWLNRQERHIALDASIPASIAHTMSRWYNDHRETNQDEFDAAGADNMSVSAPRARLIPRPLTLATAQNEGSNRMASKYKVINSHDGEGYATESIASGSKRRRRLSPVVQMDESVPSKQNDLDTLVRNWRAATPMAPVIPRDVPGDSLQDPDTLDSRALSEIDMNDFQWSVSSPGPMSPLPYSPEYGAPLPSVNIERRMAGSVILTPSVATSFGPNDSYYSPMPSSIRVPSPDIAYRLLEDSPYTPTTATSWGAPLSFPSTPASIHRLPSPDLAARHFSSRPATPSTATSWGAPSNYAETPASLFYRAASPDMGLRAQTSVPPTPSTATSWGPPEVWPPSPIEEFRVGTPDISSRVMEDDDMVRHLPYLLVWPFLDVERLDTSEAPTTTRSTRNKVVEQAVDQISEMSGSAREESPFAFVWPFFNSLSSTTIDLSENHIHPGRQSRVFPSKSAERSIQKLGPLGNICPIYDYPCIVIYPGASQKPAEKVVDAKKANIDVVSSSYGYFNLYPAVYPAVVPYPPLYQIQAPLKEVSKKVEEDKRELQSTRLTPPYPFFDLYPAGYPSLVIYPAIHSEPSVKKAAQPLEPINVQLPWSYPYIQVYPAVYPHLEIYPVVKKVVKKVEPATSASLSVQLPSIYPHLSIYPPVYPHLEIYPPVAATPSKASPKLSKASPSIIERRSICTRLPRHYPLLEIYAPGYPHIEIYPPVPTSMPPTAITPSFRYPDIVIYEPLKSIASFGLPRAFVSDVSVTLETRYPFFNIYPPVYPHLEIYPPVAAVIKEQAPTLEPALLPGATCDYPNLCIYPPVHASRHNPKRLSISIANSRTTTRVQNPRTRARRGSNQWAPGATSPISPRHRRGSINILDALERPAHQQATVAKPASRPLIKPRKSHQDLHHEVFAQLAPNATDIFAMRSTHSGNGLRRITSARVDGGHQPVLARSRTVTMAPPVPLLPNEAQAVQTSFRSSSIAPGAETIDLSDDVWGGASSVASRVSQIAAQQTTVDGVVFTLQRSVSKLDKSRYAFL